MFHVFFMWDDNTKALKSGDTWCHFVCVSPRFAGFDDGGYHTNDVNDSNNVDGRGSQDRQDEKSYIWNGPF